MRDSLPLSVKPTRPRPASARRASPAAATQPSPELWLSLLVCAGLSGMYVVSALVSTPGGGEPLGHGLGILGTALMLSTETLYSLRKRVRGLRWAGPLRVWLAIHIFTGIVGSFMVLLHTAMRFRGLAGFSMALTVLVVASGFLGRYFYTAIPRSLAGAEASAADLADEAARVQASLGELAAPRSEAVRALVEADARRRRRQRGDLMLVLLRAFDDWRYRWGLHREIRRLERVERQRLDDVERMLARRRQLERQVRMLEAARRLLGVWHVAHVPMGVALFGSAAIHVVATLYFRAGLWAWW